jgi:hypothetical protein
MRLRPESSTTFIHRTVTKQEPTHLQRSRASLDRINIPFGDKFHGKNFLIRKLMFRQDLLLNFLVSFRFTAVVVYQRSYYTYRDSILSGLTTFYVKAIPTQTRFRFRQSYCSIGPSFPV